MDFELFDELNDCDEYDDFFFRSIQSYNVLQMFDLDNVPQHLVQIDESSICVVNKRNRAENSELLKLQLPRKLMLPAEEEGRSKENDFKVLSGIYTDQIVFLIDKIRNSNKIITSENNIPGLQLYSFAESSLSNEGPKHKLNVIPWIKPNFTILENNNLIFSKCSHEPLIQFDLSVEKKVKEIKYNFSSYNKLSIDNLKTKCCNLNNIQCKALSLDLIAVLNKNTEDVVLHDLRIKDSFVTLPKCYQNQTKEIWTLSNYDYKTSFVNYIGKLSSEMSFCVYDIRNKSILLQKPNEHVHTNNYNFMKMKFNKNFDQFSTSGLNSLVQVFKINGNNFRNVFTHNGHCPKSQSDSLTTDHIWLQAGGNEYIISICNNGTLHCWDYRL